MEQLPATHPVFLDPFEWSRCCCVLSLEPRGLPWVPLHPSPLSFSVPRWRRCNVGVKTEVLRVTFSFFLSLHWMLLGFVYKVKIVCLFQSVILELQL